jgi:hypothetical protein
MIQAAKIIGTSLAITGLIGAGVYIDVQFPIIKKRKSNIRRKFSSKNSALLTDKDSKSAPSEVSNLTSKSAGAEYTTALHNATPLTADDLDTLHKFEVAVDKANYPEGRKGAAILEEIVQDIRKERSAKIDQSRKEIDEDHKNAMKELDDLYYSGKMSKNDHKEQKDSEKYDYNQQVEDHNLCSDKELKEFVEAVNDYKKGYNIPLQDSSDIDSSTDMPGPGDDE